MLSHLDKVYLRFEEPGRSCLLVLRRLILAEHVSMSETLKYGMPCFCYHKKALCYLWADKKTQEPYVLIVEGKLLDHPALEQGKRARMKIWRVNPNEDIDEELLSELLQLAIKVTNPK